VDVQLAMPALEIRTAQARCVHSLIHGPQP
jgi:hypothetical protein